MLLQDAIVQTDTRNLDSRLFRFGGSNHSVNVWYHRQQTIKPFPQEKGVTMWKQAPCDVQVPPFENWNVLACVLQLVSSVEA